MEAATSSPSAPMMGATAAMAELPQMELPQATSTAMRCGRPSRRQMPKLAAMASTTTPAMPNSRPGPTSARVRNEIDAPSSATATSSSCLAPKAMPARKRAPGVQAVRTAVPSQDGEHEGFEPGAAEQVSLAGLEPVGRGRDAGAKGQAGQHAERAAADADERQGAGNDLLRDEGLVRHGVLVVSMTALSAYATVRSNAG